MPAIRYATVGAVVLAFVLAAVVARVAQLVIHRLLAALDIVGAENREAVHARARQLMRALTMLAYGVAALASVSLALERFGVNEPQWNPRLLVHWALTHGVNLDHHRVRRLHRDPRRRTWRSITSSSGWRGATPPPISNGSAGRRR